VAVLLLAALSAGRFWPDPAPGGHGSGPHNRKEADDLDELKGLTMESVQKEGKVQEIAPGTVQISPERQQLIGVRLGTVEKRALQKVIRTVGESTMTKSASASFRPKSAAGSRSST